MGATHGSSKALVGANGRTAIPAVIAAADLENRLLQRDRMAALGTLSAGVAHEINNPLTYVLVNLEYVMRRLCAGGASDDSVTELAGSANPGPAGLIQALSHAVEGVSRIRCVVANLSAFAQGNVERPGPLDVRGILESAAQLAWLEIRHRARLSKSFAEVPQVVANEAHLGQVFLSLLINAAHAIPEGQADRHEVKLTTSTDEQGRAVVEVSDTGSGIPPEDISRVFDPFFTTKGQGSAGLGLSIAHGTIMSLGGEITVASTHGQGATFRVVLRPAEGQHEHAPPTPRDFRLLARRRLLLVDDESLLGKAISRALAEDHDVDVVTSARQALERLASGQGYDLVLCDLMMPMMTGMDLYAEATRIDPKLAARFVFMSGGTSSQRARAFLASVSNPCLAKPLDMGRLRSIVARAKDG
jgi:CheY-like chemotaxis protein